MKHFFSTRVRVVLIVAVLLAVLLAVVSNLTGLSLPEMAVKGILTPIRTGASQLTDQAQRLYNYMFGYEALQAENEALKEEIARLEKAARDADALMRENDNLRAVAELKQVHEDYKLVDCYIISRSSQEWSSSFTVNRGSTSGLAEGMCVITANGEVVGLVSEVGLNYAEVKTVLDSSLEIGATISSSGYNGMVQGGYATGLSGLLRMDYLPSNSVIRNNDQVVTTGSMVYPRNLIIGYVVDADFDDTGVAKYALLEPAANVAALEQVFVVTEYEVG
ncbi:MAG: rod shape-determining protein MreC [Oscillospiraceae bacterium]|nr:rod shape-determining protein MreC [Oscillospiraceae bacterium]